MSKRFLALLLVLIVPSIAPYSIAQEVPPTSPQSFGSSPVMFIENMGQWEAGARFQMRGGNNTMWLARDAIWITVMKRPADEVADSRVDTLSRLARTVKTCR